MKNQMKKMFYTAYFLYVIATSLQSTMFTQYVVLDKLFILMRYISFGIAGIKTVLDLYYEWQAEKNKTERVFEMISFRRLLGYAVFMLLLGIVSLRTGDRTLLFVGVLLIASQKIVFDEIVRKSFWLQCGLMAVVVISSSFNIIPDLLFKRVDIPIRHALGYTYPSVMVTNCLFIFLLYIWMKNSFLTNQEFAAAEIFNLLVYKLTDSRTGFLAFGLVALILWAAGKPMVFQRVQKLSGGWKKRIHKVGAHVYDYLSVYLSAALFVLCAAMPLRITQIINNLLTDRIRLAASAFRNYGIHLFGNEIDWIGFGGSTDTDSLLDSYNFVDSSYGYILVNFGILIFCITILLVVASSKYVRKTESKIRMFVFGIVILYCFIEPRLLEIHVNHFLFLAVPAMCAAVDHCKKSEGKEDKLCQK